MAEYVIVQHSGTTTGHGEFAHAVEQVSATPAQVKRVRAAGGLVFADYSAADKAADAINYPPEVNGLIPRARGTFARVEVDGLRVYVPADGEVFP